MNLSCSDKLILGVSAFLISLALFTSAASSDTLKGFFCESTKEGVALHKTTNKQIKTLKNFFKENKLCFYVEYPKTFSTQKACEHKAKKIERKVYKYLSKKKPTDPKSKGFIGWWTCSKDGHRI